MPDWFLASYMLLWAVALLGGVIVVGLARQVAVLTARLPPDERVPLPGPSVGSEAPRLTGRLLSGEGFDLAAPLDERTAVVFMSDSCSACDAVLQDVDELAAADPAGSHLWVVLREEPRADHPLRDGLAARVVIAEQAFADWEIAYVPYAFVVRPDGVLEAKGHLNKIDRLRAALRGSDEEVVLVGDRDEHRSSEWEHGTQN